MRKELYNKIRERLLSLCVNAAGEYYTAPDDADSDLFPSVIKHIDLWNQNVEFIEQDAPWERPAVFVEFEPVRWNAIVSGVEYRSEARVCLHIVTDWTGAYNESEPGATDVFDLPEHIHEVLAGIEGKAFLDFKLAESLTNHNHEDIVESIEVYDFVALKSVEPKAP